jgi:N-acetylmuramoyl-L-alanine amidase
MRSSGNARRCAGAFALASACWLAAAGQALSQTTAESLYREAMRREAMLRRELDARKSDSPAEALLGRARTLTQTYEDIAKLFPRSAYSDNALWQGALLAADTFWEFGDAADRTRSLRTFRALELRYPTSSLLKQVPAQRTRLEAAPAVSPAPGTSPPALRAIRREVLPDALRVTLEFDREVPFYDERVEGPPRVLVDLDNTQAVASLNRAPLNFTEDVVRQIRVTEQDSQTRVVLAIEGAARHSVYPLYNPYRIVLDFERAAARADNPALTRPGRNAGGGFSLSRQLGLGIARIVIDPGHGGYDPGAEVRGLNEAELTLDVALRLEKLLLKQPGVEVVLTRRANAFVPLDDRTAIANRATADLFLSIHANASTNTQARGIETYFLNFASNSAAEALAARENAGSSRTMRELPEIVKAIALNNKIDESRDFATLVQRSLYDKLRRVNRQARNLGVKQAPFVVLIGATMPSILVEISFLTNRQEAALLRTPKYREQIAEALFAGLMSYQKSLKTSREVATR